MKLPFFLRPTLARRILFAMPFAFTCVWAVLLVDGVIEINQTWDQGTEGNAKAFMAQIEPIADVAEVRIVANAVSRGMNDNFSSGDEPVTELIEVSDAQGKLVYLSPEAGGVRLSDGPNGLSTKMVGSVKYDIYNGRRGRWHVVVGTSLWDLPTAIRATGRSLWFYILLEFPFILLPIWFTVSRGMGPFKKLSAEIAARDENDLSPLSYEPKYEELQPLCQALDRLLSQLRVKMEREHAFVQDAAHELRTPLAVISAQAHVLALAATPAERAEAEAHMDRAIGRASHLVQQLLALAHVDAQRPLVREPLDLAHLVRQELATAAPSAMERGIELSLEAPDRLPAHLEREAFQSILHNLLDNAIRYVQHGGQIAVELLCRDQRCVLAVVDNGPGIAPRERDKVFERFYRVAGSDVAGSGLGLSIVKQAAERLGGNVSLSAGLDGRGCSFAVDIPVA